MLSFCAGMASAIEMPPMTKAAILATFTSSFSVATPRLKTVAYRSCDTADAPDSNLYREVQKQYAPDIPLGSFSQMGFIEARIVTEALQKVQGDYTQESVNEAFKNVKNFETDILCNPWYYGDAPLHIPNNVDRTVTPKGGVMVQQQDCFPISDVDPAIAQVRKIEKDDPSLVGGS